MTRRELIRQIAFEYADFEREIEEQRGPGQKLAPLDSAFAFSAGKGYCISGTYKPRRDYRSLDWGAIAREARKVLPGVRRDLAEFGTE